MNLVIESDERSEARTNMFVMASVMMATGAGPVRVRNLSRTGAQIEGAVMPLVDEEVRLRRGSFCVTGKAVWSSQSKAGLKFDTHIFVEDWLPKGAHGAAQHRTDEMIQVLKGNELAPIPSGRAQELTHSSISAKELEALASAIQCFGEALADDTAMIERHAEDLQTLEVAIQTLRKLAQERASATKPSRHGYAALRCI